MSEVTICVPVYNGAKHLPETLASIESQTFKDCTVLFSDDGSTDGSIELIESHIRKSQFPSKLLHHDRDGLVGNWNFCVQNADGEYIKFLFQDDVLEPECIDAMVTLARRHPEVGLVFSVRGVIRSDAGHRRLRSVAGGGAPLHAGWSELRDCQPGVGLLGDPQLMVGAWNKIGEPSVVLLRRSTLTEAGPFDPELKQLVDLDMWWRIMAKSSVGFVDRRLSAFRIHPDQETVRNWRSGEFHRDVKRFAKKMLRHDLSRHFHESTVATLRREASLTAAGRLRRRVLHHLRRLFRR